MYNISDFAQISGVSTRMLRYFEDISLLCPSRSINQYRQYSDEDLKKTKQITFFQSLGFSLKDIKNTLALGQGEFEQKLAELLNRKIEENIHVESQLNSIQNLLTTINDSSKKIINWEKITALSQEDRKEFLEGSIFSEGRMVDKVDLDKLQLVKNHFANSIKYKLGNIKIEPISTETMKYSEWTKNISKSLTCIYECSQWHSYLAIAFPESAIINCSDQLELDSVDIILSKSSTEISFVSTIIKTYTKSLEYYYSTMNFVFKFNTTLTHCYSDLFGCNDIVVLQKFKISTDDFTEYFLIAMPYLPIHVLSMHSEQMIDQGSILIHLNNVIEFAVHDGANSIEIKRNGNHICYRYIFDNTSHIILNLSSNVFPLLLSRIREMSKIKTSECDGIIPILVRGKPYDIVVNLHNDSINLVIKNVKE